MARPVSRSLPDVVLPVALTDPALSSRRDRRWRRLAAGHSLAMMGLFGVLAEIFQPSAKRVTVEQKVLSAGDPLDLEPDGDPRGRFAGRVTLRRQHR